MNKSTKKNCKFCLECGCDTTNHGISCLCNDCRARLESSTVCQCCGKALPSVVVRGRPRIYCSKDCANLKKFYDAFEKSLNAIEMSPFHKMAWRSELFACVNTNLK